MTDTKRAVIWAAVSSQRQATDDKISLDYQLAQGQAWCDENGYTVVETLVIPGHSRSDPDLFTLLEEYERIDVMAYQRLRELWASKGFDVLVAYSTDRLGRSGTLIHWVMECTIIKHGLRIYLTEDESFVNRRVVRDKALYGTAAATKPMDAFKDKTFVSKEKLAAQGFSVGKWPVSHTPVRDPVTGKTVRVVVNEAMRPLFTAIAQLLIDRTPWHKIGPILFARGYSTQRGTIYSASSIRQFILSGWVFGHSVRHITQNTTGAQLRGTWLFDEDVPLPAGVQIFRDVVPPLFEGEFMEQLKAELRRRTDMTGRAGPGTAHRFSRLCVCHECGALMAARVRGQKQKSKHTGYRCCRASFSIAEDVRCPNRFKISNEAIQVFVHTHLARYLGIDSSTPLPAPLQQVSEADRLADEMERLNTQLTRAIDEQLLAPASLQPRYRTAAATLQERITALEEQHRTALKQQAASQRTQQAQQQTGAFIRDIGLEAFWQLPDAQINQWLLRFFGEYRVAVHNRAVVGLRRWKRRGTR